MKKSFYISSMRTNAMIDETMTGAFIQIGDYTYMELDKPPKGRRVIRRLTKEDSSEQIRIYY